MKLTAVLFASMAAVTSAQRNLASLAAKWNVTEPTFEFDSNTFSLDFPVTDFIVDGQAKYTLWTSPDCQSDNGKSLQAASFFTHSVTGNADLLAGASKDSGAFSGRSAKVNVNINSQAISSQTSVADGIYSEEVVNNQQIATVKVCVRFGLWTTTAMVNTPVEVNFIETMLTLFVDLTDRFQIGAIEIEAKDRLMRTANQAYGVDGYECLATSTTPLTATEIARPRNPGEVFHVCVTPEAEALQDGIFMRSIDNFGFIREVVSAGGGGSAGGAASAGGGAVGGDCRFTPEGCSPNPTSSPGPSPAPSPAPSAYSTVRALQTTAVNQAAIVDGRPAGNMLTTFDFAACKGALVCRFSSILFAQFFFTNTPGKVNGEGIASLQYGNVRRTDRQLRTEGGASRYLQDEEEEAAGTAIFELEIEVNEAQARAGSGAGSLSMGVITGIAALGALVLL